MTDDPQDRIARLHEHLAATQERPVERTASRWIGEAEAVARDLVGDEIPDDVLKDRLGHVVDLLGNVEGTEDEAADEHVSQARDLAKELHDELAGDDDGT